MADVRSSIGIPLASAFSSPSGTPVIVDRVTGKAYVLTDAQVVTEIGTAGGATLADGDYGDITVGGTGTTLTIDAGAVTLEKQANLAQDQFIGRVTASTGVPETATITAAARSVLDDTSVGAMLATLGATQDANKVWAGPTSGGAAAPAFRALVAADIPSQPYDAVFMLNGAPTATQRLFMVKFSRTVIFASGLSPSQGVARTAATAQTDLDIQKNASSVGTIRWAAAGTAASFIMASQTTFSAGDILEVFAPGTPDATLANISVTLAGLR